MINPYNDSHSRLDGAHEQMKQKEASFELDLCKINITVSYMHFPT
jgi:hypothetical protein